MNESERKEAEAKIAETKKMMEAVKKGVRTSITFEFKDTKNVLMRCKMSVDDNALKLAQQNPKRYQLQAEENEKKIYVRHRGKLIVEIVLLMKNDTRLNLINLTGNMNEKFLEQLMQL